MSLVIAKGLTKTYRAGDVEVRAIKGADFVIEPASFVAFVGPSGSGKSTLLNMIGCLDHPTSGTLTVLGTDIATLDRRTAADFRGKNIGFIFQDFNLVPVLTVFLWPSRRPIARPATATPTSESSQHVAA